MPSASNCPISGLEIDHVAHCIPELDWAPSALSALGFTLTPNSKQPHQPAPDSPLVAATTANRCVMLRDGYVELLSRTHLRPNAAHWHAAIAGYLGVHLIACGSSTPEADVTRLRQQGFAALARSCHPHGSAGWRAAVHGSAPERGHATLRAFYRPHGGTLPTRPDMGRLDAARGRSWFLHADDQRDIWQPRAPTLPWIARLRAR